MSQISFRQEEARLRRRALAIWHLLEIAHLKKPTAGFAVFENIRPRLTTDRAAL
jgi:hypothetical protein